MHDFNFKWNNDKSIMFWQYNRGRRTSVGRKTKERRPLEMVPKHEPIHNYR